MGKLPLKEMHSRLFWIAASLAALLLVGGVALAIGGAFRSPSHLTITAHAPSDCMGRIAYSVELTGTEGLAAFVPAPMFNTQCLIPALSQRLNAISGGDDGDLARRGDIFLIVALAYANADLPRKIVEFAASLGIAPT
jgi:hypothetical protein